jgi:hypothetical protein
MFQPDDQPQPDPERRDPYGLRARQMAMLEDVAQFSFKLTGALQARALERLETEVAQPDAPGTSAASLTHAFNAAARTLRQTLALQLRLCEANHHTDGQFHVTQQAIRQEHEIESAARRLAVGNAVQTAVEAVIDTGRLRPERAEQLLADLDERLLDLDDAAFLDHPIGELVQRFCASLDIPCDLTLWQDCEWAKEERQLRVRPSPFATWRRRDPMGSAPAHPTVIWRDPPGRMDAAKAQGPP